MGEPRRTADESGSPMGGQGEPKVGPRGHKGSPRGAQGGPRDAAGLRNTALSIESYVSFTTLTFWADYYHKSSY